MKTMLVVLFLCLAACAKIPNSPDETSCEAYASPYIVTFPDNSDRKAEVELCDGNLFKVISLVQDDSESFISEGIVVRLIDDHGIQYHTTLVPY